MSGFVLFVERNTMVHWVFGTDVKMIVIGRAGKPDFVFSAILVLVMECNSI